MRKRFKQLPYLLFLVLILIQFIRIDKSVPDVDPNGTFYAMHPPPADVAQMLDAACMDCHSYDSRYPWYAEVAPVSWWVKGHINGGREHLNFSLWNSYASDKQAHKIEECIDEIREQHMPLKSYTWLHGDARLDDVQRQRLVDYFESLMGG